MSECTSVVKGLSCRLCHVLLIGFLGLLVYSNTFNVPFQYDDYLSIEKNPVIKDFTSFSEPSRLEGVGSPGDYNHFLTRFITWLTFAVNYRLNGLDVTGYHLVNFGIHIINALLVYFFALSTMTLARGNGAGPAERACGVIQKPDVVALATALLFVCHPIQTEAVTYIIQRLASLATLFYLLAMVLYVKWRLCVIENPDRRTRAWIYYATTLTVTSCAMLTKENTFTLPATIALYELIFFREAPKKRMLFLTPFVLTMLIMPLALTAGSRDVREATRFFTNLSRQEYLYTQFSVIVTYLRLLILPVDQNLDHDHPINRSFFAPEVAVACIFLLAVCALGIFLLTRSRTDPRLKPISFGIFWFLITLSVESSIIPITDVIAEHRVYLPSFGFFLALTATWALLAASVRGAAGKALTYAMVPVIVALSAAAYARNRIWTAEVSLWEDTAGKSPGKARPHFNLGLAYKKQGRTAEEFLEYQTALKFAPDATNVHFNLGVAFSNLGRTAEGIHEYQTVLKLDPGHVNAHYNLGLAFLTIGRTEEAEKEFEIALKLQPDFAQAKLMLDYLLRN